jgi:hypothetical protein
VTEPLGPWRLEGFVEELDAWLDRDNPDPELDLHLVVLPWIQSRMDDPYRGVRREAGFETLWWGHVPGSLHDDDRVVTCAYEIRERARVVVCRGFGSQSWPW